MIRSDLVLILQAHLPAGCFGGLRKRICCNYCPVYAAGWVQIG